ncbi:MAG: HU family DNA-binding protein [Deltaproteobacteria bacterium]|nr:HU family DNA-binding protein [Deltaproteobacteria bacterium]
MNKSDLINEAAKILNTKKEAETVVNCVLSSIKEAVVNEEKVALADFGSFDVKIRKARKGRNPQTGEEIQIAEKKVIQFRPAKSWGDEVNNR